MIDIDREYKVKYRITGEERVIKADSAQGACEKAGWMIGDCWVREIFRIGDAKEVVVEGNFYKGEK